MANPTQDLLSLIRFLLVEDASIAAKVADRVTGPSASRTGTEESDTLYPRIVIDMMGGEVYSSGALQAPIVYIYAYSRVSQADAWALYDLIRPVLRMARLSKDGISTKGSIREGSSAPDAGFNPDLGSWFVRGFYRATATNL